MPTPTLTLALPLKPDLPITLRKGIRSTCNLSPYYVALSYHRYACLSSLSIPKSLGEGLFVFFVFCGLLGAKPVDTLMGPNVKLLPNQREPPFDLGRYRSLLGN